MGTNLDELLSYLERIHFRTERIAKLIPPADVEHDFGSGRFTRGDLVRHLAGINRYMFIETAAGRPSRYPGHDQSLAAGLDAVLSYQQRMHEEGMHILRAFQPGDLEKKCQTPGGASMSVWKWLRAMTEHEAHHRGQLYWMLRELRVKTPPLFGLSSEEVREHARKAGGPAVVE